jgi:RNA polymerase sigma-70 factor (ECF subfamily)
LPLHNLYPVKGAEERVTSAKELPDATLLPLVEAAAKGDRRAAEALLRALLPRVRNLIRYLVRGDQDVDDMAQDSLVAITRGLGSYRGEGRFESWVDRIVARTTFAAIGKRPPLETAPSDEIVEQRWDNRVDSPEQYLARRQIVRLLDELPFKQRTVLVLHHVLGMSVREVASEVEAPEETVRSRLRLGMEQLRQRVEATETASAGGPHVVGK